MFRGQITTLAVVWLGMLASRVVNINGKKVLGG